MVIGLLTVIAIPTLIGCCEAISAQKKHEAAAKRSQKFHLVATCDKRNRLTRAIDGQHVVLKNGKVRYA
jgi:hypothetical protein